MKKNNKSAAKSRTMVCCFCGCKIEDHFGNNPDPASSGPEDRCCDLCNNQIVIPARMMAHRYGKIFQKTVKMWIKAVKAGRHPFPQLLPIMKVTIPDATDGQCTASVEKVGAKAA